MTRFSVEYMFLLGEKLTAVVNCLKSNYFHPNQYILDPYKFYLLHTFSYHGIYSRNAFRCYTVYVRHEYYRASSIPISKMCRHALYTAQQKALWQILMSFTVYVEFWKSEAQRHIPVIYRFIVLCVSVDLLCRFLPLRVPIKGQAYYYCCKLFKEQLF